MTTTTLSADKLTDIERTDRDRLVQTARKGFHEASQALKELKERRLYRETHATFEDFCRATLGKSAARAYQMIDVSEVVSDTATELQSQPMVEKLITNERQARELKQVPAGKRAEVLGRAMVNGKVTAKSIREANRVNRENVRRVMNGERGVTIHLYPPTPRGASKDKGSLEHWWVKTKRPEARGQHIVFCISLGLPVTMPEDDIEKVRKWLDTVQVQKVLSHIEDATGPNGSH